MSVHLFGHALVWVVRQARVVSLPHMAKSVAPTAVDPLIGQTIAGKFRVESVVAEGAMGRVYRAQHVSLDKPVAIKVLHLHMSRDEKLIKRFHREAKAASRISHPSAVHILDFGAADDGTLYIAMEFVDGRTLERVIQDDFPLSPKRIASLLGDILLAVDEAHQAGIVHRDLKPENVLVVEPSTSRERVKVCDFGVAKIAESDEGSGITVSGFVCGTPEFMAPEQCRGDEIDGRADVYAAGVILYEMLTRVRPFRGDTAVSVLTKHLSEKPVPPREASGGFLIPSTLEAVCLRALEKEPAERYQTAGAMQKALEKAVIALGTTATERLSMPPGGGRDSGIPMTREITPSEELKAATQGVALGSSAKTAVSFHPRAKDKKSLRPEEDSNAATTPWLSSIPPGRRNPLGKWIIGGSVLIAAAACFDVWVRTRSADDFADTSTATNTPTHVARPHDPPPAPTKVDVIGAVDETPPTVQQDADQMLAKGDVVGAITFLQTAIESAPDDPILARKLAESYERHGDSESAVRSYQRYLQILPRAKDANAIRAKIHALSTGKHR